MSLDEALSHPLFDDLKKKEPLFGAPLELDIEKMELNENTLRDEFLKEIKIYH